MNEYLTYLGKETRTICLIQVSIILKQSVGNFAEICPYFQANPDQSKHLETANVRVMGYEIDCVNLRAETYTGSKSAFDSTIRTKPCLILFSSRRLSCRFSHPRDQERNGPGGRPEKVRKLLLCLQIALISHLYTTCNVSGRSTETLRSTRSSTTSTHKRSRISLTEASRTSN